MRLPGKTVAVGVGVGVGAVLASWWAYQKLTTPPLPHTWEEVGEVSEITIYPLKAAKGIPMKEAEATKYGFKSNLLEDRSFMVISEEGSFINSRQVGLIVTIETEMNGPVLTLGAKGFEDVSVNVERDLENRPVVRAKVRDSMLPGVDCGDKVAEWLSRVLYNDDTKVRLLYKGNVLKNRPARKPDFIEFKGYRKSDTVLYADNSSYMLGCQSSLDDLNERLKDPISMVNFRPNIVVKGPPAYDEDDWVYVKIGDVLLRRLKPCERCIVTTIDPESGERHPEMEPITTMKQYRLIKDHPLLAKNWAAKPIFGITMGIDTTGTVTVGDKVLIARATVHPHLKGF